MKITVISYSETGNNEKLAVRIAEKLSAKHVRVEELKPRTIGTTIGDLIFGRTPKIKHINENYEDSDLIIFTAPIWMGMAAFPLKNCFKKLKGKNINYAFAAISGGADGPNVKIGANLKKQMKNDPLKVVDLLIADLLPADPKPTRDDTSNYKLDDATADVLAQKAADELRSLIK